MNRQKIICAGVDYDGGVHRFNGNVKVYEAYLLKFFGTGANELHELQTALAAKDYAVALKVAHNIKGGAGSLSLTAYYEKICRLVEALRTGASDASLLELCAEAEKLYTAALSAVEE